MPDRAADRPDIAQPGSVSAMGSSRQASAQPIVGIAARRVFAARSSFAQRQGRDPVSNPRSARLQELIHRRDKVLAVLHPPSAAHARIMEMAGCEALFVGTGGVVGACWPA